MTKKTVIQMKDRALTIKDPMSIIAFLQDLKKACNSCNIHEGAALWLLGHYLIGPVKSVIKAMKHFQPKPLEYRMGA